MAMPPVSNSSPLALCKDHDSVENEKDLAPPIKKLKVDNVLVGEDSDSVPRRVAKAKGELTAEDEKVLAELKDLVAKGVENLQDREIFNMWCILWDRKYPSQKEADEGFVNFQRNLLAAPTTRKEEARSRPAFADRSKKEVEDIFYKIGAKGFNTFVYKSDIEGWPSGAEHFRRFKTYIVG